MHGELIDGCPVRRLEDRLCFSMYLLVFVFFFWGGGAPRRQAGQGCGSPGCSMIIMTLSRKKISFGSPLMPASAEKPNLLMCNQPSTDCRSPAEAGTASQTLRGGCHCGDTCATRASTCAISAARAAGSGYLVPRYFEGVTSQPVSEVSQNRRRTAF